MTVATVTYISSLILGFIILFFGEKLKNETKEEYVSAGYSWRKVYCWSTMVAFLAGAFSLVTLLLFSEDPMSHSLYFMPLVVYVSTYVLVQSVFTDFRILKINRNILRVAYLATFILAVYNVFFVDIYTTNKFGLAIFTGLLIVLFLFSPIGASDVRMMAVPIPFIASTGDAFAILLFALSLFVLGVGMELFKYYKYKKDWDRFKNHDKVAYKKRNKLVWYIVTRKAINSMKSEKEKAVPVGPFMIVTFVVYFIVYAFV